MNEKPLRINHIEETGPLVNIGHLPDLDDLMLDVLAWSAADREELFGEERFSYEHNGRTIQYGGDRATRIPGTEYGEAEVGWFRKNPCACGGEHAFDMDNLGTSDDGGKPDTRAARGSFLGVHFL